MKTNPTAHHLSLASGSLSSPVVAVLRVLYVQDVLPVSLRKP